MKIVAEEGTLFFIAQTGSGNFDLHNQWLESIWTNESFATETTGNI